MAHDNALRAAVVVVVPLFKKFNISPVLGFLLSGACISTASCNFYPLWPLSHCQRLYERERNSCSTHPYNFSAPKPPECRKQTCKHPFEQTSPPGAGVVLDRLGLFRAEENVAQLAELGVLFLLFEQARCPKNIDYIYLLRELAALSL